MQVKNFRNAPEFVKHYRQKNGEPKRGGVAVFAEIARFLAMKAAYFSISNCAFTTHRTSFSIVEVSYMP